MSKLSIGRSLDQKNWVKMVPRNTIAFGSTIWKEEASTQLSAVLRVIYLVVRVHIVKTT